MRDNHAAHFNEKHLNPENPPQYPVFDWALVAAYFYFEWILKMMRDRGDQIGYPEDIENYCLRFAEQATEVGKCAINATAHMQEAVR